MRIGVIGGTGKEGRGLAARWASAGHSVIVGSRDAARAEAVAFELDPLGVQVRGSTNAGACAHGEVVVLSVPYSAHAETLQSLRSELVGRILIDITVPLRPPKVRQVHLPPGRAAALEARELLDESTRVVAALHHVSSAHLSDPAHAIACDVLVCADDANARAAVMSLVESLGTRALDAGPLENAVALESLTPVLLHLNKVYGSSGAGVRFTSLGP
ncbi:MAG TPA: NADPH-dependent F420 reductase [Polyangiaceae bacterium]|nr:NADPH-dependent F420 reductase [Polyangiaceae bacterium]